MDIPIDLRSDLAASFREYTIGDLQDAALELLIMSADNFGMEATTSLDKKHQKLSREACSMAGAAATCHGEAIFLTLVIGIDMVVTAITAIDKTAFMAEVDELGMEEE